jgi:polysaccharide export outer membrane protein
MGPPEYLGPDGNAVPHECATISLPPYIIEPPDILLVESTRSLRDQPVRGQHLVRPDGTIGLGIYGSAYVAGLTLDQARAVIAHEIGKRVTDFDPRDLSVDVLAYNSKVYYVITDGGGFGEQVYRLPVTGYETVLDAVAQINGLPPVASKKHIWVARPCAASACGQMILPVNWKAITCDGMPETNYQIFPGDRVYVRADKWISIDSHIAKVLSPVERLLGVTLLGSTTYNSITGRGFGFE